MGSAGATIGNVAVGLVFVALITTIVAHKNTSSDIAAAGNAFSSSIKAATGQ